MPRLQIHITCMVIVATLVSFLLLTGLIFNYYEVTLTLRNVVVPVAQNSAKRTGKSIFDSNEVAVVPKTGVLLGNAVDCPVPNSSLDAAGGRRSLIIHRYWTMAPGMNLSRKLITSFQSAMHTQTHARIIVWTIPAVVDHMIAQTKELQRCSSTLEIRSTDELLHFLESSSDHLLQMCISSFKSVHQNEVAFSDLLRFVALYMFGGIYADADMIFLKNLRYFDGLSFAYKWDRNVQYYNTALMGLPARSPVVLQIIRHFGSCNPRTFYPTKVHEALTCNDGLCKELIMMPTALFSPVSAPQSNWRWQNEGGERHLGTSTDWFFDRERFWGLEHFFPGAYTFHWHNRWEHAIHPDSFFSDLERVNSRCDKGSSCRRVYVDLGGYTGDTLALYGDGNDAVYVFEIDPVKVSAILERLNGPLAHLKPATQVFNVAAWNEDTVLRVALTEHNDGRVAADGGTALLAYDIGAWFQRTIAPMPCDEVLLKLDIEGAEVEALQSLDRAGVLHNVDHLIIEWHDWIMPAVATAKPGLTDMLRNNGLEYRYATLDNKLDRKYLPGEPWPVNHCDSHYWRVT